MPADWKLLVFSPAADPLNVPTVGSGDGDPDPDPVPTLIHDVQGSGTASPIAGTAVIVEGVVVGDHEGPSPALRGFFVQEEDADADSDPATSEGIFVFNGDLDSVSVGQLVSVTGTVAEFDGLTELTSAATTVLGDAESMPTPATIQFPVDGHHRPRGRSRACSVTLPQEMVISEYFNYDRFGEVVVALPAPGEERPMSPDRVVRARFGRSSGASRSQRRAAGSRSTTGSPPRTPSTSCIRSPATCSRSTTPSAVATR